MTGSPDPLGALTRFAYDRADRYVATTDALGNATRIFYTAAGRRAALSDPKGNATRFSYDAAGRLLKTTDAAAGVVAFAYDPVGNLVSRSDQLGRVTRFRYDPLDRLAAVVDALGGTSALSYDQNGALSRLTDANGNATAYAYDALGRLSSVTDALGGITRYGYDPRGLLTTLSDANGHARSYAYDGNRRLTKETDALGRARSYQYDPNGNPVQVTDAKNQATAFGYDAEDRLARIGYADGTAVAYTRDAVGNRTRMVDPLGTTTYSYDALRRLTSLSDPFGKTVAYSYDASGLRSSLSYPDGRVASYAYDALNRLVSVSFASATHQYSYDAVGNPLAGSFANGTRFDAAYDTLDRLVSLTNRDGEGRVASASAYTYDAVGNVLSERASGARDLKDERTYEYDALSRLVAVSDRERKTTRYSYDAVGNRTGVARNEGEDGVSATFNAADQLTDLRRKSGELLASFGYDRNGNLVERRQEDERTSFTWDAADRLVGVTGVEERERSTTTFAYDGDGNLRRETRTGEDEDDRPRSLRYTLDLAGPLSQVLSASDGRDEVAFLYGLSRIAAFGRETRFYGADVRRSVRSLTDERGKVAGTRSYDAWGVPHDEGEGSAKLATLFGFTGERQDAKSGLVYLRARWYMPELGRFLSRDPFRGVAAAPQTLHPYAYALDNPARYADPSGFSASRVLSGAGGYSFDAGALYRAIPAMLLLNPQLRTTIDVGQGFLEGVVDSAQGLWGLAGAAWRSTVAFVQDREAFNNQWQANRELSTFLWENKGDVPGLLLEGIAEPYRQAWENGQYGKIIGRGIFDVGTLFVGAGAFKLSKAALAARFAGAGRVAGAVRVVSRLAELPRGPNIVYRALRKGELESILAAQGILRPAGAVTATEHVLGEAPRAIDPWVSTSRLLQVASETYGSGGAPIVAIDLSQVARPVLDVSTTELAERALLRGRAVEMATRAAEVLIHGGVNPEAIVGVFGGP